MAAPLLAVARQQGYSEYEHFDETIYGGDYLADHGFPHDPGDSWIEAQRIHSMMSAPLLGQDRLVGTITVP